MEKYNDFYFIYVVVGYNFIKPIIHSFPSIPNNTNVVIITNTPKILENLSPHFNLIIVDLNSLRDDWSIENEKILNIEDEEEYITEYISAYKNNYRFPLQIIRFGIKWASINNIIKFVVMESGMIIGLDYNPYVALDEFSRWGETKNVLFGNTIYDDCVDDTKELYLTIPEFRIVIENYGIDLYKYPSTFCDQTNPNKTGSVGFEGGVIGFWFHDVSLVEMCFNIFSDLIKAAYMNHFILPYGERWWINFEWVFTIIISIYTKYFNTIVVGHNDLVTHYFHPEDAFFMPSIRWGNSTKWINTPTRKEFLIINRENIIQTFGYEKAKKIIYDFD